MMKQPIDNDAANDRALSQIPALTGGDCRPTAAAAFIGNADTNKKPAKRRCATPEDLLRFRIVSDPQIAPDGSRIVFVEKHVGERNECTTDLWMVGCGEAGPHPATSSLPLSHPVVSDRRERGEMRGACQFTSGGHDSLPRWSPDGTRIAFLRTIDGQTQIYTIDAAGGEARRLTEFPEGSMGTFRWSPDGKWLAVRFRPEDPERTAQAQKDRKAQGLSDPPRVIDNLYYREDGDGYFGSRRHGLYLVDARSGAHRLLYGKDSRGDLTFDFSPDSRQLVVATTRAKEPTLHPWKDELLRVDIGMGITTRIIGLPQGPKTAVCWSPDGRTIAYAGRVGKDPVYSTENLELFVCNATGGEARSLTAEHDVCLQAEGVADIGAGFGNPVLQFSPDASRIYMRLSVHGESHVASIPARGGQLVFHTRGACDVRMGNLSQDGRKMSLTVGNATTPAEVAVLDCGDCGAAVPAASAPRMLTNLNGPLLSELQLSVPETHWIEAEDGHRVPVWIMLPPGAGWDQREPRPTKSENGAQRPVGRRLLGKLVPPGKKLPAILGVHGGPHMQYCATFFHEFQVLAAAGYAVFYSNPRGSKGYGRDHCAAIRGCWGTKDWTDLQAVIEFMKRQPYVDRRRMGVMGGSYGGYMTNWVVSHCHDFAAAISDRSISNLVSWSGNSDVIEPVSHYYPGNFWDQPEARWEQSPLKYLGNVKTPLLIIHSEGDLRCNIEQAEQLYTALRVLGVRARFVRYPANTSHGMSRNGPPDLRIHRLHQILAWWREHLDPPASVRAKKSRNVAAAILMDATCQHDG